MGRIEGLSSYLREIAIDDGSIMVDVHTENKNQGGVQAFSWMWGSTTPMPGSLPPSDGAVHMMRCADSRDGVVVAFLLSYKTKTTLHFLHPSVLAGRQCWTS